jgi:Protein of unknown function DUF262
MSQPAVPVAKVLERVHNSEYVRPAIQRGFVWKTDQIRGLFDSLMRGSWIGAFLSLGRLALSEPPSCVVPVVWEPVGPRGDPEAVSDATHPRGRTDHGGGTADDPLIAVPRERRGLRRNERGTSGH